jgi:hypothetical protein
VNEQRANKTRKNMGSLRFLDPLPFHLPESYAQFIEIRKVLDHSREPFAIASKRAGGAASLDDHETGCGREKRPPAGFCPRAKLHHASLNFESAHGSHCAIN